MDKEKRTRIISIVFLITISILILFSGISFPNVFMDNIQPNRLNFPVIFIFLMVFSSGIVLGVLYLKYQSEEEEVETETKTE